MVDEALITVKGGKGGDGLISFRRLKFIPKGGPDGGDGGNGGSVYIVGNRNLNSLHPFLSKKKFEAPAGEPGGTNNKHGGNADDIEIEVPVGTVITQSEDGMFRGEILENGQRLRIARGGKGGRGNDAFKSSTNQAPMMAERGKYGEEFALRLELKLLANVGLVGFPNAGKSTLLSVLTKARPQIADYAFTTLSPNLGVMEYLEGKSLVLADIPGLIEGAAMGKGLGVAFLRHVERCEMLVFVLAIQHEVLFDESLDAKAKAKTLEKDLKILRKELEQYAPDLLKKRIVIAVGKIDLYDEPQRKEIQKLFGKEVILFSSVTHDGLEELKGKIFSSFHEAI